MDQAAISWLPLPVHDMQILSRINLKPAAFMLLLLLLVVAACSCCLFLLLMHMHFLYS